MVRGLVSEASFDALSAAGLSIRSRDPLGNSLESIGIVVRAATEEDAIEQVRAIVTAQDDPAFYEATPFDGD